MKSISGKQMKSIRMCDNIRRKSVVFVLLLMIIDHIESLKDVQVLVPKAVKIMDTVTLQCKYDLEGEPLYTVKWYKGQQEFYRYIPKELPSTQVFLLPGIDVDLSKSTPTEVVLRNVQPEVTGRYKCEVSTDSPNFYTKMVSAFMYAVEVPLENPVLIIEKDPQEIGYILKGNCTTPPSFPAINVTFYLNDKKINESYLKRIQAAFDSSPNLIASKNRRSPLITVAGLELEMDDSIFQDGYARLKCVGTLFNVYNKEKEIYLEDERPRPRPSSVLGTRDKSSGSKKLVAQLGFTTMLLLISIMR